MATKYTKDTQYWGNGNYNNYTTIRIATSKNKKENTKYRQGFRATANSHSVLVEIKHDTASLEKLLALSYIVKHITITKPSNSIPIWMFIGLKIAEMSINW